MKFVEIQERIEVIANVERAKKVLKFQIDPTDSLFFDRITVSIWGDFRATGMVCVGITEEKQIYYLNSWQSTAKTASFAPTLMKWLDYYPGLGDPSLGRVIVCHDPQFPDPGEQYRGNYFFSRFRGLRRRQIKATALISKPVPLMAARIHWRDAITGAHLCFLKTKDKQMMDIHIAPSEDKPPNALGMAMIQLLLNEKPASEIDLPFPYQRKPIGVVL